VLPPAVPQYFVPSAGDDLVYYPRLVGCASLLFSNARYDVETERDCLFTLELDDDSLSTDWDNAEKHEASVDELTKTPDTQAAFAECPAVAAKEKNYTKWQKAFARWVRQNETCTIYRSRKYRLNSDVGESEGEFRVRLQQLANEKRDQAVAKLRKRYAGKATTLENRLMRANQAIEREQQQSTQKKLDTAVSFGTAILGAVLGRKRLSVSTANRVGTAMRRASGSRKETSDVARAKETASKVKLDLAELEKRLAADVRELESAHDAQQEELSEVIIKAKVADVHIPLFGLVWIPYRDRGDGRRVCAWGSDQPQ